MCVVKGVVPSCVIGIVVGSFANFIPHDREPEMLESE